MERMKTVLGIFAGVSLGILVGSLYTARSSRKRNISKMGEDLSDMIDGMIEDRFNQMMKKIQLKQNARREESPADIVDADNII